MHVLVVEDDDAIADSIAVALSREGFVVTRVPDGASALASPPADMILLDLGLPDMDGYDVCRRLRSASDVPLIVISARNAEIDRVIGLELGADDYLCKPFGIRELIARIRAVSRRSGPGAETETDPATTHIGRLSVDRRTRRVTVDDIEVVLAPKEFDLLALLAEDPGAVVTREHILGQVWDPHWYGPTKTVDVHVASLRKKLGHPEWVETVRRVGLRLGDTTGFPAKGPLASPEGTMA